jgi:hypothetical protein
METASGECEYIQGEEGKDGVSVRKGKAGKETRHGVLRFFQRMECW